MGNKIESTYSTKWSLWLDTVKSKPDESATHSLLEIFLKDFNKWFIITETFVDHHSYLINYIQLLLNRDHLHWRLSSSMAPVKRSTGMFWYFIWILRHSFSVVQIRLTQRREEMPCLAPFCIAATLKLT